MFYANQLSNADKPATMSQNMMPQTQTHQNLKKNLEMLMLDDTAPVPQVLNRSAGAHTMTNNLVCGGSSENYASLLAAQQAVQHHNTQQQLARLQAQPHAGQQQQQLHTSRENAYATAALTVSKLGGGGVGAQQTPSSSQQK